MHLFEKMLFIKSVSLFKFVEDDALLAVASRVEELRVGAGELIIAKGSLEMYMYMIVSGRVKIHNEDRIIKEFGNREVFGELAALSPKERIASASAIEETLLLKINHSMIYELMQMDIGLTKGIIEFLCERIRSIAH